MRTTEAEEEEEEEFDNNSNADTSNPSNSNNMTCPVDACLLVIRDSHEAMKVTKVGASKGWVIFF